MTTATATRERPIIFSGPMVRAILDGRKTQTRRVVKPQPHDPTSCLLTFSDGYRFAATDRYFTCPYGQPGDRLWVRETHWADRRDSGIVIYDASPEWGKYRLGNTLVRSSAVDGSLPTRDECRLNVERSEYWSRRSPIHMPRWASRITLEITDVRVQRVQEISGDDCWAEGCNLGSRELIETTENPLTWYRELWDTINGKSHPWESNCWVWALTFKVFAPARPAAAKETP